MKKQKWKKPKKEDFQICRDCNYYFEEELTVLCGGEAEFTFCMTGEKPIGGRCIFKILKG